MAVVSERLGECMRVINGERVTSWADVFYENTGQRIVDHFEVVNNFDSDVTVVVYTGGGTEILRRSYPPGTHTIPPEREDGTPVTIRWNKAGRTTDFSISMG